MHSGQAVLSQEPASPGYVWPGHPLRLFVTFRSLPHVTRIGALLKGFKCANIVLCEKQKENQSNRMDNGQAGGVAAAVKPVKAARNGTKTVKPNHIAPI